MPWLVWRRRVRSAVVTVTGVPIRCMNRMERLVGLLAAVRPEPIMTVARTVADVLSEHVAFEVECIDRMHLNVYVPQLQYAGGLLGFIHRQLGLPIASTAPAGGDHRRVHHSDTSLRPGKRRAVGGLRQGPT